VIPTFKAYLFDIDGTLLDSAADICGALQCVLDQTDCKPVTFEFLRGYIGLHLLDLFSDLFPAYTTEQYDELIRQYRTIYLARGHAATRVYRGVAETLAGLGGRKSTATTKGTLTTRAVLEQFGLIRHFDHVQGTDGFPCKPAPDVVLKSLTELGMDPADCLMVGDAAADMEAGRRAGVTTCAVRYGYGNPAEMAKHEPDYWVDDLRELLG
jgi:HAD superfamily hydrolase (TIGR01509 family)